LAEFSAKEPLVCLIDDAQWLDEATSQVLGFVGRRLLAEPVALIFAVRDSTDSPVLPALPELVLQGLAPDDARSLLAAAVPTQLAEQVRERIVAETRGNPLALLELPRGMNAAELAGGFALPATGSLVGRMQDHYAQRVLALPEQTQRLLVLAA